MSTVWDVKDVHDALQAAAAAGQETARLAHNDDYLSGYAACLRLLALAFGLRPIDMIPERTEGYSR